MADDVKLEGAETTDTTAAAPSTGAVSDSAAKQPADSGTLLSSGEAAAADIKPTTPVAFPEDWRQKFAGDNAEDLKTLSRYTSPDAIWSALKAIRSKMSAGELKAVTEFPAAGDDKAKAEWRKQNGIPETPDGYEPKVEGLVFGDADKPMLDSFKTHALGKNWTPAQFNEALSWYANEQQTMKARQEESDNTFRSEARDALYGEWGPADFKANLNAVKNLLAQAPSEFSDRLLGARLADGRLLGDDPGALKWLAGLAREMNPGATLVPPGTTDVGKSLQSELDSIRKISREEPHKLTPALEQRQTELIAALNKTQSRAA